MASELDVGVALIEWINSFSLGRTIDSADELIDSSILWEILQDIDPHYFLGELPEQASSEQWVPRWQNLKHLFKLLTSYVRDQCEQTLQGRTPDLKSIAQDSSTKETNKLLKIILVAAINSPNAQTYVMKIQELSLPTQATIKDIILEASQASGSPFVNETDKPQSQNASEPSDDIPPSHGPAKSAVKESGMDQDLAFEERAGKIVSDNDRLTHEKREFEKKLGDLHDRLGRLQENNDTLQRQLTTTEDRLTSLKSGKGDSSPSAKALETKFRQQEDVIAVQEAKLSTSQDEIESLRKTVESLRIKTERTQKLQDDYDEIRNERDQLARRANAAEKYKQKLQASQDFEKENQNLQTQIRELRQQLNDTDIGQKSSSDLLKDVEEYRRILPRIEQDRHELQQMKKQLEFDNHALSARLENANEQQTRDQETISNLRERQGDQEEPQSPSTPRAGTPRLNGNVQDESAKGESQLQVKCLLLWLRGLTESRRSEIIELKKEILELKKQNPSAGVRISRLKELLDNANEDYKAGKGKEPEHTNGLSNASERLGFQIPDSPTLAHGDGSPSYMRLYERFKALQQKIIEVDASRDEMSRELSEQKSIREFAVTNLIKILDLYSDYAKVGMVDKDKLDMIKEIGETNSAELIQTRTELDAANHKARFLEADYDAHHLLLDNAVEEREKLRKALEKNTADLLAKDQDQISNDELRAMLDLMKAHADKSSDGATGHAFARQMATKVEKSKERTAKMTEHIIIQDALIKSSQDRIKQFEASSLLSAMDKEKQREILHANQNLARENALIASAWYDLQSRLQSSHVTVSRHRPAAQTEPRSWLGRQRKAVEGM